MENVKKSRTKIKLDYEIANLGEENPELETTEHATGKPLVTIEVLLYAVLLVVAFLLRFYDLGRAPLLNEEATAALNSWRFYQGQGLDTANYSPLLTHGTALFFFLFGDSDGTARLLTALFGTAMALLPYFLRRELGRVGALVAAALLAISPSFVHFSRRVDGAIIVAVGALALVVAVFSYLREHETRYIYLGAGALAVTLTASPDAYAVIALGVLFFVLVILAGWWLERKEFAAQFTATWHSVVEDSADWRRGALITFGGTLVASAFAFGLNLGGLQATLNLLAEWAGRFGAPSPHSVFYHLQLLMFYELTPLIFAWGGMLYYFVSRWFGREDAATAPESPLILFLGYWFIASFILHTILRGAAGTILLTVLPLILLTGWASGKFLAPWLESQMQWVAKSRRQKLDLAANSLLLVPLALPPIVFFGLQLATYTYQERQEFLLLAAITAVLIVTLIVLWSWLGGPEARRAGLVIILLVATAAQLRVSWGLSFHRANAPYELMFGGPTSPDVRAMLVTLDQFAEHRQVERKGITMAVQADLPTVLRWYLRDFSAQYLLDIRTEDVDALITADKVEERQDFKGPRGYIGQSYRLRNHFAPANLSAPDWVEWVLFHHLTSGARGTEDVKLWVRQGVTAE